jgi:hypothetical protein
MNLGVALPSWMFSKDKKAAPLMLLGLVGCGILLPLGLMSWYMLSSSKFTGPNQIMNDTFPIFMYSKFCVKESQVRQRCTGLVEGRLFSRLWWVWRRKVLRQVAEPEEGVMPAVDVFCGWRWSCAWPCSCRCLLLCSAAHG